MSIFDMFRRKDVTAMQSSDPFFNNGSRLSNIFRSLNQAYSSTTGSKISVNPDTAYQISAYWLAVRAISEDIAKLPVKAYSLNADNTRTAINDIPILKTLREGFNPSLDPFTGKQLAIQWMQTYGNAYFEVTTDSLGEINLYPIHPTRVQPFRPTPTAPLHFHISFSDEVSQRSSLPNSVNFKPHEILHLRGMGNESVGVSIGSVAAESLGIAIAAQNFTGAFFGNNLSIGATIETDKALNAEQKDEIRKAMDKRFAGSKNAHKSMVLDRGFKFSRIQMDSTDAELLNTRKFQVEEIARWFRIPPHKLMDMTQAKFANLEQNDLNYATDTLVPWISRFEVQVKFHFHRHDNIYIDIDEKGLSRGDMAARTAWTKEMFAMGAMNAATIADREGLPEPDGGHVYYIPLNLAPVDLNIKSKELDNQKKEQDLQPDVDPDPENLESNERISKLRFDSLKGKVDAYGVAVRAGAITPQTADEQRFRKEGGFPAMSPAVNKAWVEDEGVRRPITLQTAAQEDIEKAQAVKATSTPTKEPAQDVTAQSAISAYLPSMSDSLSRLTRKEHNSHESAAKKEPVQMKEHLDKFYIKFEQELADCFQIHADFICNVQKKDKFTSDKLLFMSKEVCNWEKSENQSDIVIEYLLKEIAQLDDAPKLGEIRQDDDGMNYIWNMSGWVEVDVLKK